MNKPIAGLILAAGKGTRMKSELPKGLFEVCGIPIVELISRAMRQVGIERPIVVVGHRGNDVIERIGEGHEFVWQTEQRGTGHAAQMAHSALADFTGCLVVVPGDVPLLTDEALRRLIEHHLTSDATCTIGACRLHDPSGYGRIIRDSHGRAMEIVEERDASPRQRGINEVNTGIYCFDARTLFRLLPRLQSDNDQGELYLTDTIRLIHDSDGLVETFTFENTWLARGVNDRWQLAESARELGRKIVREHCLAGVTVLDPDSTHIDFDVVIGVDTTIHPGTILRGRTTIGAHCEIGPHTLVEESSVGDFTSINMSRVNEATIGNGVKVGPFAHVRPGTVIGDDCRVGNFVEVKKSRLSRKVSASHLAYLGDSEIGEGTNIGAGTITCNYDGYNKHPTVIGANCFIGSNSTIVAPVTIGDDAFVAAGSVITKNVPSDALAIGRGKQEVKEGWVPSWRKRMVSN